MKAPCRVKPCIKKYLLDVFFGGLEKKPYLCRLNVLVCYRDDEQIDKIINNPDKPTFDNTIINVDDEKDGEHYYDLLGRVSTVFFNLLSAETNDEMDALAQKMSPILTKHANDIRLNEKLFERIQYVHRHHRKLTPEEKMLLEYVVVPCWMLPVRSVCAS